VRAEAQRNRIYPVDLHAGVEARRKRSAAAHRVRSECERPARRSWWRNRQYERAASSDEIRTKLLEHPVHSTEAMKLGTLTLAAALGFSATAFADPKPAKADADMQAVLDALAGLGGKPVETLTPAEARKQPTPADAVKAVLTKKLGKVPTPEAVGKIDNRTYGTHNLNVRIYTPLASGTGALPIVVYFHGGGWVIADNDVYDASPRAIANTSGAVVVAVEYRKAPENKFPAAHDDAYEGYKWALANAASFNGDPKRVAVVGESAGGNLAINVAIKARDDKAQVPVQMTLIYPVAGADMTTPSYVANANAKPLNKPVMEWFVTNTFTAKTEAKDPRIDLVNRKDLAGLPDATVITDEIDPLRSEGQQLAKNLKAAGVKVDAIDYVGVTHEFFGMGAAVVKAKKAEMAVGKDLKAAFAKTVSTK